MLSRRHFLGTGGLGVLALSSACRPPGLEASIFAVEGAPSDDPLRHLAARRDLKNHVLGYPINMNDPPAEFFEWRQQLFQAGIDAFAFNNVGNPFRASPIPYNTHDLERKTILRFGRLFGFPEGDTWGFISHSGTDSNMHGMYMGRTLLQGRTGVLPRAYFTLEAHYSVQILRDLLGMEGVIVETLPDGGMSPDDLSRKLERNADAPALVVASVGTTFKGAVDTIDALQERLAGYESFVHVDAALFGGYLPFTPYADEVAYQPSRNGGVGRYDSIAVSCHKFFGFPAPAGIFVARRETYEVFNELFSRIHNPEYIHHVPGTITCSRDAVKPAEFHFFTRPPAIAKQRADAKLMLQNARYLLSEMQSSFPQLSATISNRLSNTVYFRKPSDDLVRKYSLATMNIEYSGQQQEFAHVMVMPHVTRKVLTEFLNDLDRLG